MLNIHGYGDELTVNDIRIGDLSPSEHEKIEMNKGGRNYKPLKDVVISHIKDSSTLICRKPSLNREIVIRFLHLGILYVVVVL